MAKHMNRDRWIRLFKRYEENNWDWNEFYSTINFSEKHSGKSGEVLSKLRSARDRFKKTWWYRYRFNHQRFKWQTKKRNHWPLNQWAGLVIH